MVTTFPENIFLETNFVRLKLFESLREQLIEHTPSLEVSIQVGKNNVASMKFGDCQLHDPAEPIAEAKKQVESIVAGDDVNVVALFGLGLGYHAEALERRFSGKIIVFEPSLDILAAVLKQRPLPLQRTVIVSNPADLLSEVQQTLQFTDKKVVAAAIPAYAQLFSTQFEQFKSSMDQALHDTRLMENTIRARTQEWVKNLVTNTPKCVGCASIEGLKTVFEGKPAILVAAGPSLDKNIDLLRDAMGHALIMSVNTAVPSLDKKGVIPDIITVVESVDLRKQFEVPWLDQVSLAPSLNAFPGYFELGAKNLFPIADLSSTCGDWLKRAFGWHRFSTGGSVACAAFSILKEIGCDPIVLVGQDLAYTGGARYPDGAKFGRLRMEFDEKTQTLVATERNYELEKLRIDGGLDLENRLAAEEVGAWGGEGTVLTSKMFSMFRVWYEAAAIRKGKDRRYINATQGGAHIEGFEEMTLSEVLKRWCTEPLPAKKIIDEYLENANLVTSDGFNEVIEEDVRALHNDIEHIKKTIEAAKAAIKAVEEKGIDNAQLELHVLAKAEEAVGETSSRNRLLDVLVAGDIDSVRSNKHEDLSDDSAIQTINSIKRSCRIFEIVLGGAVKLETMLGELLRDLSKTPETIL